MTNRFKSMPVMVLLMALFACQPAYQPNDLITALNARDAPTSLRIIESGIDVNVTDSLGQTPAHLASQYAMASVLDALIAAKADLNQKDQAGYTPLNYALIAGDQAFTQQLLRNGAVTYHNDLPDLSDGPYVDYTAEGLYAYYLVHDSLQGASFMNGKQLPPDVNQFKGWGKDTMTYTLAAFQKPGHHIQSAGPVFILGDIHGQYDRLIQNLTDNAIIDSRLNWNYGEGNLVFVGDIMDRGDKVTEALWLIYKLEKQAQQAGGSVNMVLGNHEMLVLNNDLRYLAPKYKALGQNTGLDQTRLYHPNSVMGQWLRARPAMVKINDVLVVHGGISALLLDQFESIEQINHMTAHYFKGGKNALNREELDMITTSFGPFWYRGFFQASSKYEQLQEAELDQLMAQLDVQTIVVGHTENDEISSYFNGKVMDVNIPLWNKEVPNQALLIEDGAFYRLGENGVKTKLK